MTLGCEKLPLQRAQSVSFLFNKTHIAQR